jgi:hypothetical protein
MIDAGRYCGILRARRLRRLANVTTVLKVRESGQNEVLYIRSFDDTAGECKSRHVVWARV